MKVDRCNIGTSLTLSEANMSTTRSPWISLTAMMVAVCLFGTSANAAPSESILHGSGKVTKTVRKVPRFQGILLELPADVKIIQGQTEGVSIETDDNLVSLIETVVQNDQLKIRTKRPVSWQLTALKIVVNARIIKSIAVSGSGNVNADHMSSSNMAVSISGSGDTNIANLNANSLSVLISGSGNFSSSGRVEAVNATVSGSGDLNMATLAARTIKLSMAGSGNAKVWASQTLKVNVAGSADVGYYGDATVTQSVDGSGSVTKLGTSPKPGD